jgi:tetratricopeptide (TPR) repeat protein
MRTSFLTILLGILLLWSCSSNKQTTTPQNAVLSLPKIEKQTLSPNDRARFDAAFAEAMLQREAAEYDASYELLQHCYAIDSTNAQLLYELSGYYQTRGTRMYDLDRATLFLEQAVALSPDNYWYNQALSSMYLTQDTLPLAIAVQEHLRQLYPEKEEIYSQLIGLYQATEQYPQAIEMLNALEDHTGKSAEISMEKFRMYVKTEQKDSALSVINSLVKEYPEDSKYKAFLANYYRDNGLSDKSFQIFNDILKKDSNDVTAQLGLYAYYFEEKEDSLANDINLRLLKNPQLDFNTRTDIMRIYAAQHDSDSIQVMRVFREVLQAVPEQADVHLFVASYLEIKEQPIDSIESIYRHILSVEPDNALARLYLLRSRLNHADYEGAIQVCLPALDYNREEIEFYFYLANAYYILDRKQEAFDICEQGLEYITENTVSSLSSDMYALYGDISYSMNKKELCFTSYEKSISYNPDNIGCLNNYAYYLSEENRELDKAEEMSYHVIKAEPTNVTYLDTYAWILFMKGEYADAKNYISRALGEDDKETLVNSPEILSHAGDIYYKCGEVDTAVHYWTMAESIESTPLLKKKIKTRKYWKK